MALVLYGDMYSSSSTPEVHGRASAGIDVLESSSLLLLLLLLIYAWVKPGRDIVLMVFSFLLLLLLFLLLKTFLCSPVTQKLK